MTTMMVRALPLGLLGVVLAAGGAEANPQGGTVVGGQATITQPAPNNVTVKQQSSKAIINWRSFSVGGQESVLFKQPSSSSVALNRVTGNDLSTIAGSLSANGIVFLVNPNGVVFTRTAKVDVNGMIATTSDIANNDFMAGKFNFAVPGTSGSSVINQGKITAAQGGLVGLVAPSVRNDGVISARLGRVTLASGDAFTVDLYGDQLVQFAVPAVQTKDASPSNGPLVSNTGTISASGGTISLTADTAARIVDEAINTKGLIEASAVHEQGGEIVLDGGPNGGVTVAGTLDASGKRAGQTGGTVKVLGASVALNAGTKIDVSGYSGGGTALIGGNFHGAGPEHNAATTIVVAKAMINADALTSGNGGQVAVWSDQSTTFNGAISARGGTLSGNGGFVEVSGYQQLTYGGAVDLRAPVGLSGTLLLDPENVTISATGDTPTLPTSGDTTLTGTADNSVLSVSTLENALKFGNVTVQTGTSGTQAGDIEVASTVGWTSGNSLTLSAYRNITIDNGVTIFNIGSGSLSLRADNTGTGMGAVAFNGTGRIDFTESTGTVSIYYNPADNPADSVVNSSSYLTPLSYASAVILNPAAPNQLTAYMLANTAYDLQNIENDLSGNYALGRTIDASSTALWNKGAGFSPIGPLSVQNLNLTFQGIFDGNGGIGLHSTINGLVINSANAVGNPDSGLFATVGADGIIRNLGLVGGTITDTGNVGALAGANLGRISNSFATTNVANDAVTANGQGAAGGLVGFNRGTISNSYATGSVSGILGVGGLVGSNNGGTIVMSYAAGAIKGQSLMGGLAGDNDGTISQSFATGGITAFAEFTYPSDLGGLVGSNGGTINHSYATGSITNTTSAGFVGSLIGQNTSSNGSPGVVEQSYAIGAIELAVAGGVGGLVGANFSGPINSSYWNPETTKLATSSGGTPLTTAQFQSGILPTGFDPTIWTAKQGQYPILTWQVTPPPSQLTPTIINFGTGTVPPPITIPLTWSVANSSSTYGTSALLGSNALFGVAPSDSGSVTGMVRLFKGNTPATLSATLSAGTYTEEVTGLAGSGASKYTLSPTGDTVGTLTINPKTLTWIVANASSAVGAVPALGAARFNGVLAVDSANLFGTISVFNGSTLIPLSNTIPAGTYAEKVTALTGLASPNYTLGAIDNVPGTLTINSMTPPSPPPPNNNSSSQQQQVLNQTQSQTANPPNNQIPEVNAIFPTQSPITLSNGTPVDFSRWTGESDPMNPHDLLETVSTELSAANSIYNQDDFSNLSQAYQAAANPGPTTWQYFAEHSMGKSVGDVLTLELLGFDANVTQSGGKVIIAFRGTVPGELKENIEKFAKDYATGNIVLAGLDSINTGFSVGSSGILTDILNYAAAAVGTSDIGAFRFAAQYAYATKALSYPGADVVLTGHSLGGGMAAYAGASDGIPAITFDPSFIAPVSLNGAKEVLNFSLAGNVAEGQLKGEMVGTTIEFSPDTIPGTNVNSVQSVGTLHELNDFNSLITNNKLFFATSYVSPGGPTYLIGQSTVFTSSNNFY